MRVSVFGVGAGGDRQVAAERLAHLGALFARDGEEFGLFIQCEIAREAGVGAFLDVPAVGQRPAAQLDRRHAERTCQVDRRFRQHRRDLGTVGEDAAADGKTAGHQRLPEQRRAYMVERQNPGDPARRVALRDQMMLVPRRLGDRLAPGAAVEGRRIRMRVDIGVPPRRLVHRCEVVHWCAHAACCHATARPCCAGRSASARAQSKSSSNLRSLPAIIDKPL